MTPGVDDDVDGFDDFPETHLEDDDYEDFVAREFDPEGRLKGDPPIGWIIGLSIVLLAVLFVVLFL